MDRTEDNGDRVYKRKLSDGKEYEVTYTKGEDGKGMLLVDSKIHGGFHHSGGASALRGN